MVDYDTLKALVDKGYSQRQIGEKIGKGQTSVRYWLAKYGLSTTGKPEKLEAIRRGKRKLTCLYCGKELTYTQKKYCSVDCQADYEFEARIVNDTVPDNAFYTTVKRWLLRQRGHQCEVCENTEWMGQPIPLELHHVDGNAQNGHLTNLQLICPNCHALTDTYKARNMGNGRHYRRERYKNGKSY